MATEFWVNIGSGNGLLHQAITWTNVDLPSVRYIGIHFHTILQEILQPSITKISWKITFLKFLGNPPGANELSVYPVNIEQLKLAITVPLVASLVSMD